MSAVRIRPNVFDQNCPTRRALDLIADKWSALIVTALSAEPQRFNALRRSIGGISQKVLTERLRDLERDGIVWRTVYDTLPISVEYGLTRLGRSLSDPLAAVTRWAEAHFAKINAARVRYDHDCATRPQAR